MQAVAVQVCQGFPARLQKGAVPVKHLILGNAEQLFAVLGAQDIQPEFHNIFFQIKIAVEGFSADPGFLTDLRDRDLLEGLAFHQAEQSLGNHVLAVDSGFVGVFVIHKKRPTFFTDVSVVRQLLQGNLPV